MTLFNLNPYECNDLDTLREWVVMLREMTINLQGMDKCGRKISDLLYQVNDEQGEANKLLKEQNRLLKQRLSEYEIAFSAEHHNHVRRLN